MNITNWDIPLECIQEMAEYTKQINKIDLNIPSLIHKTLSISIASEYLKVNHVVLIMSICVFLWIILRKHFRLLLPFIAFFIGRTGVLCFLIYNGRLPERVMLPFFLSEIVLLLSLFLISYFESPRKKADIFFALSICTVFLFASYFSGQTQYRKTLPLCKEQEVFFEGMHIIQEYCLQHPTDRFILHGTSFCYYKGSTTEIINYGTRNSIYSGNWYSNSPSLLQYTDSYLKEYEKDFYFIIYDYGTPLEEQFQHPAICYYINRVGFKPIVSDRIEVPSGGVYLVLHFNRSSQ